MRVIDRTGKRYGTLTVLKFSHMNKFGNACWLCVCDCGKETVQATNHLSRVKSCGGCTNKHGHHVGKASRTYKTWDSMLTRCNNPNSKSYRWYGAIGVKVCERWHKFENFLADMGERPEGMTLDRVNPYGDYEPANCKWADKYEQANNKRTSKFSQSDVVQINKLLAEGHTAASIGRMYDTDRSVISAIKSGKRRAHC